MFKTVGAVLAASVVVWGLLVRSSAGAGTTTPPPTSGPSFYEQVPQDGPLALSVDLSVVPVRSPLVGGPDQAVARTVVTVTGRLTWDGQPLDPGLVQVVCGVVAGTTTTNRCESGPAGSDVLAVSRVNWRGVVYYDVHATYQGRTVFVTRALPLY